LSPIGLTFIALTLIGLMLMPFEAAVGGSTVAVRLVATLGCAVTRSASAATTATASTPATAAAFPAITRILARRRGAGDVTVRA